MSVLQLNPKTKCYRCDGDIQQGEFRRLSKCCQQSYHIKCSSDIQPLEFCGNCKSKIDGFRCPGDTSSSGSDGTDSDEALQFKMDGVKEEGKAKEEEKKN